MTDKPIISGNRIGKWNLVARDYKILALSSVITFLGMGGLFQTNALNTRGCETRVGSVICSAVNTLLIAGRFAGTDAGFIDRDYVSTVLDDSDVTWIENAKFEPLQYPEGYFALANQTITKPGVKSAELSIPKTGSRANSKKPAPVEETEASLDEPIVGSLTDENAEKEIVTDTVTGAQINRKVLRDYANYVKAKVESESIDLEGVFTIVAEGVLNERGRLDTSIDSKTGKPKSRIISSRGDESMRQVAKEAIAAVGDSGWLIYLRNQGIEKINFSVTQSASEVRIQITSEQPTAENAKTIASGLRGIIQGALLLDRNNVKKLGSDEKVLLNSAKTSVNRRQFVLDFVMSKPVAQEMIKRRLGEMDGKPRSGGSAESKSTDKTLSE